MDRKTLLYAAIAVEGGLILVGYLLLGSSAADLWSGANISWETTAYALLGCTPMFAALVFTMRTDWKPILQLREDILEKIRPLFSNSKLIDLALIAFFAGVGEELFFRGWMQSVLVHRSGALPGILITSVIFGLLHYLSTTYAVYAMLTGVYLGLIFYFSGNLYIVMAIHAFYDFVALLVLVGNNRDTDSENLSDVDSTNP